MYETKDGYVFETFRDGKVIFYRDSYERHCEYREVIRGEEGLDAIQNALISPDTITTYSDSKSDKSGENIAARYKIYRRYIQKIRTNRGQEMEYWEILLKKKGKQRRKITTAYITSALEYAIINKRIETIEYKRKNEEKLLL